MLFFRSSYLDQLNFFPLKPFLQMIQLKKNFKKMKKKQEKILLLIANPPKKPKGISIQKQAQTF